METFDEAQVLEGRRQHLLANPMDIQTMDDFLLIRGKFPKHIFYNSYYYDHRDTEDFDGLKNHSRNEAVGYLEERYPVFTKNLYRACVDFEQKRDEERLDREEAFNTMGHPFTKLAFKAFKRLQPRITTGEITLQDLVG